MRLEITFLAAAVFLGACRDEPPQTVAGSGADFVDSNGDGLPDSRGSRGGFSDDDRDGLPDASDGQQPWKVPDEVEDLYLGYGAEDAESVVVFVQGGPFSELRPELVESLPGTTGRRRVMVHQPWTLEPGLLASPESFPRSEAAHLNRSAMEMLDRVVRQHMADGVPVSVVGHSYGALLTLLWVATYERPVDTKILAGRVAMPEIVTESFRAGRLYWFPDGLTPEPVGGTAPAERILPMLLQSDLGGRSFTRLLADTDLSRLTFVYGTRDRLVGSLSDEEVEFLTDRGARVVPIEGGDHRAMWEPENAPVIEDALRIGGGPDEAPEEARPTSGSGTGVAGGVRIRRNPR